MKMKKYKALNALANETTPRVRADMDDAAWGRLLIDQNEEMVRRLRENDPLDVRRGLGRGVVVFSIYEVMISALRETGVDTSLFYDDEKHEVVLTASPTLTDTANAAAAIVALDGEDDGDDDDIAEDGLRDDLSGWGDTSLATSVGTDVELHSSAEPALAGNE